MPAVQPVNPQFESLAEQLVQVGRRFDQRGWVPASSGNFSARVAADQLAITASGRHKGELQAADILLMNLQGQLQGPGKASYETGLHLQLYRREPALGAVLHSHSVAATVLTRSNPELVELQGYELQKLFDGMSEPQQTLRLPVFPNEQDINKLATRIDQYMQQHGTGHAYLIQGHGLYTWAADIATARLRVEALEFMLDCELAARACNGQLSME